MQFIEIKANKKSISARKLVCGVGINDAKYVVKPIINGVQYRCPYHERWSSMIRRCLIIKYNNIEA